MAKTSKKLRNVEVQDGVVQTLSEFNHIKPLNYIQETYLQAIHDNLIIFGIGSAGTGKTFISANYASHEIFNRRINQIIITRPCIEVGRSLGYLPGTLQEKYSAYLEPFDSAFKHSLGDSFYKYLITKGQIVAKPLTYMRGVTFENCIVLLDEGQNCTKHELKMILSRIGKNCKMIISGDPNQSDISNSGLADAAKRLEHIKGVEVVRFTDNDIVRSELCKQIILAYKD